MREIYKYLINDLPHIVLNSPNNNPRVNCPLVISKFDGDMIELTVTNDKSFNGFAYYDIQYWGPKEPDCVYVVNAPINDKIIVLGTYDDVEDPYTGIMDVMGILDVFLANPHLQEFKEKAILDKVGLDINAPDKYDVTTDPKQLPIKIQRLNDILAIHTATEVFGAGLVFNTAEDILANMVSLNTTMRLGRLQIPAWMDITAPETSRGNLEKAKVGTLTTSQLEI